MQKHISTFSQEEIAANPRSILDVILRTEEGGGNLTNNTPDQKEEV